MSKKYLILLGNLRIEGYGGEVREKFVEVYRVPEGAYVSIYSSNGELHREIMIKEHTVITHQGEVIELSEPRKLLEYIIKHLKVGK